MMLTARAPTPAARTIRGVREATFRRVKSFWYVDIADTWMSPGAAASVTAQREAVVLRYYLDLSVEEAAQVMGGSLSADTLIVAWGGPGLAPSTGSHFGVISHGKFTPLPLQANLAALTAAGIAF
jgi:hypothetical protein